MFKTHRDYGSFGDSRGSGEQLGLDLAVDVGEAEPSALILERQPFVIDPQEVEQGRVQVVDVDLPVLLKDVVPVVVGLAEDAPRFHSASRHPDGKTPRVVVPAVVVVGEFPL